MRVAPVSPPPVAGKLTARWSPHARGVARIATLVLCISILAGAVAQVALAETLPDSRVYEMVTPPNNQNADVYVPETLFAQEGELNNGVPTRFPFQAADNGEAITYVADPTTGGYGVGGSGLGNQYLARAMPAGGWSQTILQPAGRRANPYQGFSSDLSVGVLKSGARGGDEVPLASGGLGGGYVELYARDNGRETYRSLFTTQPERAPEEFGSHEVYSDGAAEPVPVFAGGSAGFGSLVFEANDALLSGGGVLEGELRGDVAGEITAGENQNYLYDSDNGVVSLVDVSPAGKVVPNATFGAPPFNKPRKNPPGFGGVVSEDGSRVYWTALGSETVFVRVDNSVTLQVSVGAARYWASADDGRFAFYVENGELYRFDVEHPGEREALAGGVGAGVVGVLGVGDDGARVYAVAEAVLGSGVSSEGEHAVEGGRNLYLLEEGHAPVFIAGLSEGDGIAVEPFNTIGSNNAGGFGDWQPGLGHRTARVDGDGGGVVFMSGQRLRVAGFPGGVHDPGGLDEVFEFDAGSGVLVCVSCSRSGEAPPAALDGAAAFLPVSWSDTYLPQWLGDDGNRVFFDTPNALVPQDTNGHQDVYEWEREGTGTCTAGSGVNGGCIYLLSGGDSEASSWFIGASESGNDAFIVTRAQLAPEDENDAFDVYDARVGGSRPVSPPACSGAGCQGVPPPAPSFATPPSATFNGVGNFPPPAPEAAPVAKPKAKAKAKPKVKRCRAGFVKRNGRCLKKKTGGGVQR